MTKSTNVKIFKKVQTCTRYRGPLEPGLQLVITLRYLVTGNSYKSLQYSNLADYKQRVTQCVVPFVTHIRTRETKPVVVGHVQGYVISSTIFCDTEVTLPYCFLRYHLLVPINQQDLRERYFDKCNQRIRNSFRVAHNTISLFVPEVCQAIIDAYEVELFSFHTTPNDW